MDWRLCSSSGAECLSQTVANCRNVDTAARHPPPSLQWGHRHGVGESRLQGADVKGQQRVAAAQEVLAVHMKPRVVRTSTGDAQVEASSNQILQLLSLKRKQNGIL